MNDELGSIIPSAAVLGSVGAMALFLTITRGWATGSGARSRGAGGVALVVVLVQAAHFGEELLTGFHVRFPALFGRAAIPLRFFVFFNLAWLGIWVLSAWGVAERWRAALFPLWFLGIASLVNGIAHPTLAALAGGYFPGLVTAPLLGVVGLILLRRLILLTSSGFSWRGAA